MKLSALTNAELIRHVDNTNTATELERILAQRLDAVMIEIKETMNEGWGTTYDPRPAS